MSEEQTSRSGGSKTYTVGNIGQGARVMIGEHQTWIEQHDISSPENEDVLKRFDALMRRLIEDTSLDDEERHLSVDKAKTLAESLVEEEPSEGKIMRALVDAKSWFGTTASWAWEELTEIIKAESAQKLIAGIAKTGVKAAIAALLG